MVSSPKILITHSPTRTSFHKFQDVSPGLKKRGYCSKVTSHLVSFQQRSISSIPTKFEIPAIMTSFSQFLKKNLEYMQYQKDCVMEQKLEKGDFLGLMEIESQPLGLFNIVGGLPDLHGMKNRHVSESIFQNESKQKFHTQPDKVVSQEGDAFEIKDTSVAEYPCAQILEWKLKPSRGSRRRSRIRISSK
uniref:Uncharacterized protein n=1 Tax=Percolomonas cosmopolitus TaxID=63605 RepID=A0A7S1PE23_9EUKA